MGIVVNAVKDLGNGFLEANPDFQSISKMPNQNQFKLGRSQITGMDQVSAKYLFENDFRYISSGIAQGDLKNIAFTGGLLALYTLSSPTIPNASFKLPINPGATGKLISGMGSLCAVNGGILKYKNQSQMLHLSSINYHGAITCSSNDPQNASENTGGGRGGYGRENEGGDRGAYDGGRDGDRGGYDGGRGGYRGGRGGEMRGRGGQRGGRGGRGRGDGRTRVIAGKGFAEENQRIQGGDNRGGRGRGRGGRGGRGRGGYNNDRSESTSEEKKKRQEEEEGQLKAKIVPIKSAGTFNWGSLKQKIATPVTRPLEEEKKEERPKEPPMNKQGQNKEKKAEEIKQDAPRGLTKGFKSSSGRGGMARRGMRGRTADPRGGGAPASGRGAPAQRGGASIQGRGAPPQGRGTSVKGRGGETRGRGTMQARGGMRGRGEVKSAPPDAQGRRGRGNMQNRGGMRGRGQMPSGDDAHAKVEMQTGDDARAKPEASARGEVRAPAEKPTGGDSRRGEIPTADDANARVEAQGKDGTEKKEEPKDQDDRRMETRGRGRGRGDPQRRGGRRGRTTMTMTGAGATSGAGQNTQNRGRGETNMRMNRGGFIQEYAPENRYASWEKTATYSKAIEEEAEDGKRKKEAEDKKDDEVDEILPQEEKYVRSLRERDRQLAEKERAERPPPPSRGRGRGDNQRGGRRGGIARGQGEARGRGERGRGEPRGRGDGRGRGEARGRGDIRGRGGSMRVDQRGRGSSTRGRGDVRGRGGSEMRGRGGERGRGEMRGRGGSMRGAAQPQQSRQDGRGRGGANARGRAAVSGNYAGGNYWSNRGRGGPTAVGTETRDSANEDQDNYAAEQTTSAYGTKTGQYGGQNVEEMNQEAKETAYEVGDEHDRESYYGKNFGQQQEVRKDEKKAEELEDNNQELGQRTRRTRALPQSNYQDSYWAEGNAKTEQAQGAARDDRARANQYGQAQQEQQTQQMRNRYSEQEAELEKSRLEDQKIEDMRAQSMQGVKEQQNRQNAPDQASQDNYTRNNRGRGFVPSNYKGQYWNQQPEATRSNTRTGDSIQSQAMASEGINSATPEHNASYNDEYKAAQNDRKEDYNAAGTNESTYSTRTNEQTATESRYSTRAADSKQRNHGGYNRESYYDREEAQKQEQQQQQQQQYQQLNQQYRQQHEQQQRYQYQQPQQPPKQQQYQQQQQDELPNIEDIKQPERLIDRPPQKQQLSTFSMRKLDRMAPRGTGDEHQAAWGPRSMAKFVPYADSQAQKAQQQAQPRYGGYGSNSQPMLNIDGSMGEGGGQLYRTALALGYLLHRPITMHNIRANRPNGGGLKEQHLTCVNTLYGMFMNTSGQDYTIYGNQLYSPTLSVQPLKPMRTILDQDFIWNNGQLYFKFDIQQKTVGSVNLVLQCLMPCLMFHNYEDILMKVTGGTITAFQPTVPMVEHVLHPLLLEMGVEVKYNVRQHGVYPDVMGEVTTRFPGLPKGRTLKALNLTRRGPPQHLTIDLYINSTEGYATQFYYETFKPELIERLKECLGERYKTINIQYHDQGEVIELPMTGKYGQRSRACVFSCDAIVCSRNPVDQDLLHPITGLAADFMLEGQNFQMSPYELSQKIMNFTQEIANLVWQDKIIVNERITDQLLIYMALAKGKSVLHTGNLSRKSKHTLTQIALINQFLPETHIQVTNITKMIDFAGMPEYEVNQIEVNGIGYNS